jgi:hypothetical protein
VTNACINSVKAYRERPGSVDVDPGDAEEIVDTDVGSGREDRGSNEGEAGGSPTNASGDAIRPAIAPSTTESRALDPDGTAAGVGVLWGSQTAFANSTNSIVNGSTGKRVGSSRARLTNRSVTDCRTAGHIR